MWKRGLLSDPDEDDPVILEGLRRMYTMQDLFDCKFLVGPEKVPFGAHKLILAMASTEFKRLLYSASGDEPIPLHNFEPKTFELLLRYIYLNESPLDKIEDEKQIISLWYATSRIDLNNLRDKCSKKIKINVSTCLFAYRKSLLLHYDDKSVIIISRCEKLIAVKTPDILARIVDDDIQADLLKSLFAVKVMVSESELDLFETLAKYAHAHGWKPSEQYYEKDKNGKKNATFQKKIRDALKEIGFLSMTLKEFDEGPSKSGFLTEEEVTMIRKKIANDSPMHPFGFSRQTTKRRYEIMQQKDIKIIEVENKDIEKLTFTTVAPMKSENKSLWVTHSFLFCGLFWKIIIYKINIRRDKHEYSVYLKCEGSTTPEWKCHAQLDIIFDWGDRYQGQVFENIPWFCFHPGYNYSQMKPRDISIFQNKPLKCHFELSTSKHRVSYKNTDSNVSLTYGTNVRDYE
ncbi:uncharacterized protein LOC135085401 isoform X1 [Ostrinia nubilalis]|uniref:uncharacterized protein LOC135085401 isoform X1 n=1 Tax=Ostrinia nubilalis TaxID=29057 RepID=UPI0030825AC7